MSDQDGKCPRCGCPANPSVMSFFNTDTLCIPCHELERKHPKYEEAREVENTAVRAGDYNFPGVGLPQGYAEWAARQMTGEG